MSNGNESPVQLNLPNPDFQIKTERYQSSGKLVMDIMVPSHCGMSQQTIVQIIETIHNSATSTQLGDRPSLYIVDLTTFGADLARDLPLGISESHGGFWRNMVEMKGKGQEIAFIVDSKMTKIAFFNWVYNAYSRIGGGNDLPIYVAHTRKAALEKARLTSNGQPSKQEA